MRELEQHEVEQVVSENQNVTQEAQESVEARQRVRLVYEKGDAIKFISHQDEFRLWERTLRRADLPLLYKQGFNPQPHMQFASPLGVGFTGVAEVIDLVLSPPVPLDALRARITAKLPPGVMVHGIEEVAIKAKSLQGLLIGADYTIILYAEPGELAEGLIATRIADFLVQTEIWRERERKGKAYRYNLRPLIFELLDQGYDAAIEEQHIFLRVQQRPGATGRPDEVVAAMGLDDLARTLRRDKLYYSDQPQDVTVFAAYPEVPQAQVADPLPVQHPKGRRRTTPAVPIGRSIAERAGDEFV